MIVNEHMFTSMTIPVSDPDLVCAVRSGDRSALDEIYHTHSASLAGFIQRKVGDHQLAEDILHDLFLNIWSRHETWEVHGELRTYLFSAARNHVWSHFSKQRVRRDFAEVERATAARSQAPRAIEKLQGDALARAVALWIGELPPRRREVFELSRYHHMTYQEIADHLGISIKTVETQMSRTLKHLRERLGTFDAARA